MPSTNPAVNKRARDRWYRLNKDRQIRRQMARREELLAWFTEYKRTLKCAVCGRSFAEHPEWCDFHHTNRAKKEVTVSQVVKYSIRRLLAEIARCSPICALCHRSVHAKNGRIEGV